MCFGEMTASEAQARNCKSAWLVPGWVSEEGAVVAGAAAAVTARHCAPPGIAAEGGGWGAGYEADDIVHMIH